MSDVCCYCGAGNPTGSFVDRKGVDVPLCHRCFNDRDLTDSDILKKLDDEAMTASDRRAALEHAVAEAARVWLSSGEGRWKIVENLRQRTAELEAFLAGKETT